MNMKRHSHGCDHGRWRLWRTLMGASIPAFSRRSIWTHLALLALLLPLTSAAEPAGIAAGARAQIGVTVSYDSAYRKIAYPGGDVPKETGVCSDVVVRAMRAQGMDLQKL